MNSILSPQASLSKVRLPFFFDRVPCGFPSPADDFKGKRIDIMAALIRHESATFFVRNRGLSMIGKGIFDGDILLVDRAERPRHGDVVVAVVDGNFTCKTVLFEPRFCLHPENPEFEPMYFKEGQEVQIWGVVIASFRLHRPMAGIASCMP